METLTAPPSYHTVCRPPTAHHTTFRSPPQRRAIRGVVTTGVLDLPLAGWEGHNPHRLGQRRRRSSRGLAEQAGLTAPRKRWGRGPTAGRPASTSALEMASSSWVRLRDRTRFSRVSIGASLVSSTSRSSFSTRTEIPGHAAGCRRGWRRSAGGSGRRATRRARPGRARRRIRCAARGQAGPARHGSMSSTPTTHLRGPPRSRQGSGWASCATSPLALVRATSVAIPKLSTSRSRWPWSWVDRSSLNRRSSVPWLPPGRR